MQGARVLLGPAWGIRERQQDSSPGRPISPEELKEILAGHKSVKVLAVDKNSSPTWGAFLRGFRVADNTGDHAG